MDQIDDRSWEISRKQFISSLLLLGAASQIPFLSACDPIEDDINQITFETDPLSADQVKTIQCIQLVLFPKEGNGPSALEINADKYLVWVLNDSNLDKKENDFIINKLDFFINLSLEKYNHMFFELSKIKQEDLIAEIIQEGWGKTWVSRLLTLLFEALLLDPFYGGNPNSIGWEWLNHNPGQPRPNLETSYPDIINRVHEV